MFLRGLKDGKIARVKGGGIQELHRSQRLTCRKTASVPNGCITGGRDSKEEIARRNADKPVVSASKGIYIHYESYVAIYRRFSVQHDYYTFYTHPCISIADWLCNSLTLRPRCLHVLYRSYFTPSSKLANVTPPMSTRLLSVVGPTSRPRRNSLTLRPRCLHVFYRSYFTSAS